MRQVYLDHQASTPVLPEVFDAMKPFFTEAFGNPSSLHQHGLRVRDALAEARSQYAALINAESPDDIIFTSDGTESANLAIKGVAYANQRKGNHLVVSLIDFFLDDAVLELKPLPLALAHRGQEEVVHLLLLSRRQRLLLDERVS